MLRGGDMLVRRGQMALLGVLCVGLASCGDDLSPDPSGAGDKPSEYQPGWVGQVRLLSGSGGAQAVFRDRPDPLAPEIRAVEGECALYTRPDEGLCSGACPDGVCTPANQCAPTPRPASAGIITVTGLRQGLRFAPGPRGYEPETPPPSELFDVGASIRITAPGDSMPPFSAQLSGVPPLEVGFDTVTLQSGRPTRLTWTAAGVGRVALELILARPGAPFSVMLLCESDDNGALTIPAGIASRLRGPLAGEEESVTMTRLERAVVASPAGPIEVVVGSRAVVGIERRP